MTSPALQRSDSRTCAADGEAWGLALLWVLPAVALLLALFGVG